MRKILARSLIVVGTIFIINPLNTLYAAYQGECWVISNGDTVYKLNQKGQASPNVIPNLTQAQAAEVNPKTGIVWISVSAANAVYRYDPAEADPNAAFKAIPNIKRASAISINPAEDTVWIAGEDVVKKVSGDGNQVLAEIAGVYEPSVSVNVTDGSCWITHSRGAIYRHDAAGTRVATANPAKMGEPKFVTVNPKTGNAWVADSQSSIIVKLDANGQELLRITDIKAPSSPRVDVRDGGVWLVSSPATVIKLSADGKRVKEFPGGMAILAICPDPRDGGLWVADQLGGSNYQGGVYKYSANGIKKVENPIPLPSYVSVGLWPLP
jgi:streptogramin lyase